MRLLLVMIARQEPKGLRNYALDRVLAWMRQPFDPTSFLTNAFYNSIQTPSKCSTFQVWVCSCVRGIHAEARIA